MPLAPPPVTRRVAVAVGPLAVLLALLLAGALAIATALAASGASAAPVLAAVGSQPNLVTGSAYLAAPANLIRGHYYSSFPGYADFGLTIDGALALAATGDEDPALTGIVTFLRDDGKDPHGNTIDGWTGIGTKNVDGGSLADEALLAEVVEASPRNFGGHDLIAALNAAVCPPGGHRSAKCAGPGNYFHATSVFDQALGIMAQFRAGQASAAAAPVRYLESLRNTDGSFPSLIPNTHDHDVDSTAMAVMALALAPGTTAAADVTAGIAWIAQQQLASGGFHGTSGVSVNTAGLAIQALTLQASRYHAQIARALAFLAREQNPGGGFPVAQTGSRASDVRASAQAVGGAVGTSFGTLRRNLTGVPTPSPTPTVTVTHTATPRPHPAATVTDTQPATPATTPASSSPASAAATSTPPLPPSSAPPTSTGPARLHTVADTRGDGVAGDLWWATGGVAGAALAVIAVLLLRRRRLYPAGPRP